MFAKHTRLLEMYDLFYMYMCMNVYIFNTGCAGGKTPRTLFGDPIVQGFSARDGHLPVRGKDVTNYWFLPILVIIIVTCHQWKSDLLSTRVLSMGFAATRPKED